VFVTLRMEDSLRAVVDQVPHYLKVCVVDTDALAERRRLFGPPGCETEAAALLYVQAAALRRPPVGPAHLRQPGRRCRAPAKAMPGCSR
jgi:hypothetical protein